MADNAVLDGSFVLKGKTYRWNSAPCVLFSPIWSHNWLHHSKWMYRRRDDLHTVRSLISSYLLWELCLVEPYWGTAAITLLHFYQTCMHWPRETFLCICLRLFFVGVSILDAIRFFLPLVFLPKTLRRKVVSVLRRANLSSHSSRFESWRSAHHPYCSSWQIRGMLAWRGERHSKICPHNKA